MASSSCNGYDTTYFQIIDFNFFFVNVLVHACTNLQHKLYQIILHKKSCVVIIKMLFNDSQLAKMKKSIPDMSLP